MNDHTRAATRYEVITAISARLAMNRLPSFKVERKTTILNTEVAARGSRLKDTEVASRGVREPSLDEASLTCCSEDIHLSLDRVCIRVQSLETRCQEETMKMRQAVKYQISPVYWMFRAILIAWFGSFAAASWTEGWSMFSHVGHLHEGGELGGDGCQILLP